MNLSHLKDPFSAMTNQGNSMSFPREPIQSRARSIQNDRETIHSVLSSSSSPAGFSLQGPLNPFPLFTFQRQKISVPVQLPVKSELIDQRNMIMGLLSQSCEQSRPRCNLNQRIHSLSAQNLSIGPEPSTDGTKSMKEVNSLITQITSSINELEKKFQIVTTEKDLLEKKLKRYEQIEIVKLVPCKPIQYMYVPKKKRTRRLSTQVPRSHKCPDVQCQKIYGSDTSLNLHIRKKHPYLKLSSEKTPLE